MHWKMTDKEKYTVLMQRYWEAETSPEEERALARYAARTDDPAFDQLRGVLGYLSIGRQRQRQAGRLRPVYAWVAAALLIITVGLGFSTRTGRHAPESELYIRQVYGVPVTDGEQVMASVEATLSDFFSGQTPAEANLLEMFRR